MLEIKDLQVNYGDFIAIDKVNLSINQGDFFTLLGPSGCGKTTTLRAIAGFNKPSRGQIIVNGKDITNLPVEKRGLGMVFQSYALFPTMTVYDNIAYGLEIENKSKTEIQQRVQDMADMVQLSSTQLKKNVSELSGGQQQRVAIARALAKSPEIVLFDEPLSNLDAKLRKQLRRELKRIQREAGLTAIYVTHDQEEALEMSDHIAVFNNGFVEQLGTPLEIYDKSASEFVCNFIGEANVLGDELVQKIARQTSLEYHPGNRYYLREEKIMFDKPNFDSNKIATIDGFLVEDAFRGNVYSITVESYNTLLKVLSRNNKLNYHTLNEPTQIYINIDDILEFGGE